MTDDLRELLPLYALGILEPDEVARVEHALRDGTLAGDLASYQRVTEALAVPVTPSTEVKVRLLAAIGGGRFERFAAQLRALFDVGVDRAHELLGLVERTASWVQLVPGVAMLHFVGGPAAATSHCAFLRLAPGATFPLHGHRGEESAIVMCGRVRDLATGSDRSLDTGETWTLPAGTSHTLHNDGTDECICAVRATDGIVLGAAS